jgi:hypothetical protein
MGESETVLSCLVSDTASVDMAIFRGWLEGISPMECARQRESSLYISFFGIVPLEQLSPEYQSRWKAARQLNFQECLEEYQVCEWMAPYLSQPQQFQTQMLFNITPDQLKTMIYEYYSFDEDVMREFLGKTMSKTARRELEDVSEQTKTTISSTRRQFDNLKRIHTHVENEINASKSSGKGAASGRSIIAIIEEAFLIPVELASQYMHIVFLSANRIETFKSRLNVLDFKEWNSLAGVVMAVWGTDMTTELDSRYACRVSLRFPEGSNHRKSSRFRKEQITRKFVCHNSTCTGRGYR